MDNIYVCNIYTHIHIYYIDIHTYIHTYCKYIFSHTVSIVEVGIRKGNPLLHVVMQDPKIGIQLYLAHGYKVTQLININWQKSVCLCVWEREIERGRQKQTKTDRETEEIYERLRGFYGAGLAVITCQIYSHSLGQNSVIWSHLIKRRPEKWA